MGLQTAPAYIGKAGFNHPVELDRNLIRSLSGARTGLARWGDFAITPTGVSGQVSISRGGAFLLGPETALQGSYYAFSEAAATQLFAAASGNPRIDSLLLRVADDQYGSIPVGAPQAYFDVVQGVASGSPSARPDSDFNLGGSFYVPGAWFRLADVRRNLGDTTIPAGQITSNLRMARLGGKTIADVANVPVDPVLFDINWEPSTFRGTYWNGTAWVCLNVEELITQTILGADTATVSFQNIPQYYDDLIIRFFGRTSEAVQFSDILVKFNNDSGSNYALLASKMDQGGTGVGLDDPDTTTPLAMFQVCGSSFNSNVSGAGTAEILGYSDATRSNKIAFVKTGVGDFGNAGHYRLRMVSWSNAGATQTPTALTRIDLTAAGGANMKAGTKIRLFGRRS